MEGCVAIETVVGLGRLGVGRRGEDLGEGVRLEFAGRYGEGLGVVGRFFEGEGLRLRQMVVVGRRESGTGSGVRRD